MSSGVNRIPILTFHALEQANTPISFPPALFERAIKKWYAAGWRTISLYDTVRHLRAQQPLPEKTFVLTFDDGYASVYQAAFPLLQAHNLVATIFIAPNRDSFTATTPIPTLYHHEMLHWQEIREMNAHGIDFGAHTLTHRDLTQLDDAVIDYELRTSQQILSDALGKPVPLLAYPKGKYNARVRAIAARYFEGACSDRLGIANFSSDLLALERVETFYLQQTWAADTLINSALPFYLAARNIPRRLRRFLQK